MNTAVIAAKIAQVRKALVNVTGLAGSLLALGLIPDPEAAWIASGIAVVTVVIHYLTPNAKADSSDGPQPGDETVMFGDEPGKHAAVEAAAPVEAAPAA